MKERAQRLLTAGRPLLIHGPGAATAPLPRDLGEVLVLEQDPQGQALRARVRAGGPLPVLLAKEPSARALRLLAAALAGALGQAPQRVTRLGGRAPWIIALTPGAPGPALVRLFPLRLPAADLVEEGRRAH